MSSEEPNKFLERLIKRDGNNAEEEREKEKEKAKYIELCKNQFESAWEKRNKNRPKKELNPFFLFQKEKNDEEIKAGRKIFRKKYKPGKICSEGKNGKEK